MKIVLLLAAVTGFLTLGVKIKSGEIVIDRDNIKIDKSVKIKPGTYKVEDKDKNGVLHVEKDGITIDFQGATLWGADKKTAPNRRKGIGISIKGRKQVILKNAKIHGFLYNIVLKDCKNVSLENCDVSFAKIDRINPGHWLLIRNIGSWRSYGAGIWLEGCQRCNVYGSKGRQTQNGVILVDSENCEVLHNDFSYNSGWGIGLWNSSQNKIMYNKADFCVGGGDAAGITIAHQSHKNWIMNNSFTHSGVGLFLTNRSDARKPEDGSCNDNVVAYNDGSYAGSNAFEMTFGNRNILIGNIATYSNYGFWCGYSNDFLFIGNIITNNWTHGIAIEQGHGHRFENNEIARNMRSGIALWAHPSKKRYPSKDYTILNNQINQNRKSGILLKYTTNVVIKHNNLNDNLIAMEFGKGVSKIQVHKNNFKIRKSSIENLALRKKARFSLSGKDNKGQAKRSVDGKRWGKGSSDVNVKKGDFWEVDLGGNKKFNVIVIHPRSVEPYSFLSSNRVLVSKTGKFRGEEKEVYKSCAQKKYWEHVYAKSGKLPWPGMEGPLQWIEFPPVQGRYVRIVAGKKQNYVGMAEIELFNEPDLKEFWKRYSSGEWFVWVNGGKPQVDAQNNYWKDAKGRKISGLIQGTVNIANPLSSAAKVNTAPERLTFKRGIEILKKGEFQSIRKDLIPYLKKVDCKIDTNIMLPKPQADFKMYRDTGKPSGWELMKVTKWGPKIPTVNN